MSSLNPGRTAARTEHNFFMIYWAIGIVAVLAGFMPGLLPYLAGTKPWPPIPVHMHAVLFYGWVAFFLVQIWLVRTKNVRTHMTLGLLGIGLGAAMIVVGTFMTFYMAKFHYLNGETFPLTFMIVPLIDMVSFTILFVSAISFRKNGSAHKRLMLLAATVLLDAGFGRFLGPHLAKVFGADTMLGAWFTFYVCLFPMLMAAIIYDLVTRHAFHIAYVIGVPFMLVLQLIAAYILTNPAWPSFAKAMIGVS